MGVLTDIDESPLVPENIKRKVITLLHDVIRVERDKHIRDLASQYMASRLNGKEAESRAEEA